MNYQVIIFGTGGLAQILYTKLCQTGHAVSAFVLEKKYKNCEQFLGLPVIDFEKIEETYPPCSYKFIIGIGGNMLNKLRTRIYHEFKAKGYQPISYIDKSASILPDCSVGEHCILFENVVAHSKVRIGDNVYVLPNTYLGHHSVIEDNCFIAAQVSLAGGVIIKKGCFLGASSCVANSVTIGESCVLAMGSYCTKSSPPDTLIINNEFYDDAENRFDNYFQKARKNFE